MTRKDNLILGGILLTGFLLAISGFNGCVSASTNIFRTEQTLVNSATAAYVGYTNALYQNVLHISPDQSNAVREARLKFAASVSTLESWRVQYETNSTVQPFAQAALDAALSSSSNFIWVINYVRAK